MPPLARRSLSTTLPTLLSLSKLVTLPAQHFKRSWTDQSLSTAEYLFKPQPIEPEDPPDSPVFWWKLGLSVALVLLGGVFAGLTLALMGSDDLNLRVLSTSSDDPKERKAAEKVLKLLSRGRHWVLVVLLLGNVIVNESLPIFLDQILGGGLYAVIVSTTMIVIFGEIIPQAVCVRYGLGIGGVCAPLVYALMIIFAPIAWPVAKLLDRILGKDEGHTYKKAELKSFLQFHREGSEPLRDDEIGILNGVLSLNEKHASQIMTPIADCLVLPANKIMDHEAIDQILLSGFSRIPIHEPGQKDNFIGMLLVKRLITYSPDEEWPISKFPLLPLPEARPDINCFQALDYFQTGRAHLLLISTTPGLKGGAIGIVSLEDLIEEIIGEEIVDETDRYQDNKSRMTAKRAGPAAVMRGIIERQRVVKAFSRQASLDFGLIAGDSDSLLQSIGTGRTSRDPIQLDKPNEGEDGLLIRIDDGAIVADRVPIPAELNGAMDTINEHSGGESSGSSTNGKDADQGGSKGKGAGSGDEGEDKPLLRDLIAIADDEIVFPNHQAFESACKELQEKYAGDQRGDQGVEISASRTNGGWEWKEHKTAQHHGYLTRRTTRYISDSRPRLDGLQEYPENEDLEDGGTETHSLLTSTQAAEARGASEKIEIEHHIVYSRTYHVPQLLIRAWDEGGAPLPLTKLLSSSIIQPNSQLPLTPPTREDAIMLDPHSPFPLIQQGEHPTTGEVVWGIHPCQVALAVEEILRGEAEERFEGTEQAEGTEGKDGKEAVEGKEGKKAEAAKDGKGSKGLRWLECWLMLSGGVVDLRTR